MSDNHSDESTVQRIGRSFHAFTDHVYTSSVDAQSTARRFGLQYLLVLVMAGHRFRRQRGFGRATEMAYHTLFALVPVTALILMVATTISSSSDELEQFLFQHLLPTSGSVVTEYIRGFATQAKAISLVSSLLLVVTSVLLLKNIEDAINDIWEVDQRRGILVKLAAYWSLLTLGPVLIFGSLYLTSELRETVAIPDIFGLGLVDQAVSYLLSFLFVWIVYYLLYTWLPNVRVSPAAGLISAITAGTLWEAAKFGFDWYVAQAVTYSRIYGSLSILPLFLLWLYLTWIIVMWGCQVSYVWQHIHKMKGAELLRQRTGWHRVDSAVRILVCVARYFEAGTGRVSSETVSEAALADASHTRKIAGILIQAGMIHYIDEQGGWYALARPPESIAMADLVMLFDGIEQSTSADLADEVGAYTATLGSDIRGAVRNTLGGKTLKSVMDELPHHNTDGEKAVAEPFG
jgi:membrane protein